MKLGTINRWLRRIGLVLVVEHPTGDDQTDPVKLSVTTAREYDRRPIWKSESVVTVGDVRRRDEQRARERSGR